MPTTWGLKVQELSKESGHSAAWLAKTAKISRGTITNWLNNPNGVQPEPEMVGKVAKAFGKTARELAPYGGYPVLPSEGEGDLFGGRLILPTYCIAVHNAPSTYDARGVGARSSHDFLRPDHHPIQGRPVAAIRAAEVLGAWIEISVSFHVNMFTPT